MTYRAEFATRLMTVNLCLWQAFRLAGKPRF